MVPVPATFGPGNVWWCLRTLRGHLGHTWRFHVQTSLRFLSPFLSITSISVGVERWATFWDLSVQEGYFWEVFLDRFRFFITPPQSAPASWWLGGEILITPDPYCYTGIFWLLNVSFCWYWASSWLPSAGLCSLCTHVWGWDLLRSFLLVLLLAGSWSSSPR